MGSDRQGRGRLLDALRRRAVRESDLAGACGWPEDPARAERVAVALVAEGFAGWSGGKDPVLQLASGRPTRWAPPPRVRSGGGQEADDVRVDDLGALHVEEVAGAVDDLEGGALGQEVERDPMDDNNMHWSSRPWR